MSGTEVRLVGPDMDALIASLDQLADYDPVVIGGLAVMCRLGAGHRVTLDIDSAFDRPDDPPTTRLLVASGVAADDDAPQRVIVGDSKVDVIDTFEISIPDLPDEAKGRLFVCAHRFAWESGTQAVFVGDTHTAQIRVATVDALVAMKAHALAYGSADRRRTKRGSDLFDLLLLARLSANPVLRDAPWGLASQVREAIINDLSDASALAAVLKRIGPPGAARYDTTTIRSTLEELIDRLAG